MRLIDADWLEELLLAHEQNARAMVASGRKTSFTYADGIRTGYADVGLCPTIEAEPVKHGRWIKNDNGTYSCSECQSWIPNEQHYYARYCLHCGAKMDEVTE